VPLHVAQLHGLVLPLPQPLQMFNPHQLLLFTLAINKLVYQHSTLLEELHVPLAQQTVKLVYQLVVSLLQELALQDSSQEPIHIVV
jgi:hypothetical protein